MDFFGIKAWSYDRRIFLHGTDRSVCPQRYCASSRWAISEDLPCSDFASQTDGLPIKMNTEGRPVYPRLQFLDLVPRLTRPTTDEGFDAVHEVKFKVKPQISMLRNNAVNSLIVEWNR